MLQTYIVAIAALLLFTLLPVSAQDRCAQNKNRSLNASEKQELERLLDIPPQDRFPTETAAIESLQERMSWDQRNGVGNGWITDQPDSCVLYISTSNEPVLGTRIYRLESRPESVETVPVPEALLARVNRGPARIRSGPGLEHLHLGSCDYGMPLTVWSPASEGWLRASCFGVNGWIHESMVQRDEGAARSIPMPPAVVDGPPPVGEHQATVTHGPAHIRGGPGLEHAHLDWCGIGWSLTVWEPATDGWLRASCYGVNGWIHESLVAISE